MKKSRYLFMLLTLLFMSMAAYAQKQTYSGVVVDSNNEPVIGASVVQKGTTNGAITDYDGNFKIAVTSDATLTVSYIGYKTQDVRVKTNMHIVLQSDAQVLNDLVVIGYGVQKKSVVTASIAKVSADDLEGKTRLRADDALKGMAAGVNVTSSSGQPGSKSMIRVRGIGTINNTEPLYIIDGMPTDQDGMESVNPNDIESIEVLKDAASGAIYGARAANGVILVTTKKGKTGKAQINYNFSYGWQSAWKKRDVTGATDYAVLQNEKAINGGQTPLPEFADPWNLTDMNGNTINGFGTDWQSLLFNDNAPIVQHDVSVSGASDKINYYLSLGYFSQDGIVGGNYGQSNYDRLTIRSNTNYNLIDATKERNFLNKLDLGVNVSYMRVHNTGVDANSTWGSPLGSALYLAPTLPVTLNRVNADGKPGPGQQMIDQYSSYDLYTDAAGNPYTIPGFVGSYNEQVNPIAMMQGHPTRNWSQKIMPKFSLDLQLYDNLKYHFSWSAEQSFWGNESAQVRNYYLSGNNTGNGHTSAGAYKGNRSTGSKIIIQGGGGGGPYVEHHMSSYFGRLSYSFDEKYMFQATVRRDGSSRFGSNNKYGTFPSVSVGWNIHKEAFMKNTQNWLSNLKFRASWGKNGNDNIGEFAYTTLTYTGGNTNSYFGKTAVMDYGSKATRLANEDLKWEESEQTDLGNDFGFFNNALTFSVDYFVKKTNGMIIDMPIPSYVGEQRPLANVGDMENKGWEFGLGYRFGIADARFAVKGNASYLKNTLKNLGNDTGFLNWGISQFTDGGTRAENGQPFPFFYGYKTGGVFQNIEQVKNYTWTDPETGDVQMIQPNAQPGDMIFVDTNNDGKITSDDRTKIGKGTPVWTFGLNLNAEWKGFDFNVFFQGVSGVDVFDATYRSDISSANFPTWILDRWTGEGTSNRVPILKSGDASNWVVSDLYVRDGSYLRLKNITLGYTLPRKLTQVVGVERFRMYVRAENLVTWTKYWGFDPEIGTSGTSLGVDYGVYPQARTWTVGFNISL